MGSTAFGIWDGIAATAVMGLGGTYLWKILKKPAPSDVVTIAPLEAQTDYIKRPQLALSVSVRGGISPDQESASYRVSIYDKTESETPCPIRSSIDKQSSMTGYVTIEREDIPVPPEGPGEWNRIFTVPQDLIEFGYGGRRKLLFVVEIPLAKMSAESTLEIDVSGDGFMKAEQRLYEIYTSVFYLESGLRTLSPHIDSTVVEKTSAWIAQLSPSWNREARKGISEQFQTILADRVSQCGWEEACSVYATAIRRYANDQIKQKIIMLFFQLLEEDPNVQDEQCLKVLFELSRAIRADMGLFCQMADKNFPEVYMKQPADILLGIHDEMTPEEIDQRIRQEYKRWNDRVIHSNPEVRNRAKQILTIIARRRNELSGK